MTFSSLENPIRWLFLAHALAGALALIMFSLPLIAKKGGKLHIRTGWIYTGAMVFVGLSTFIITPWRMFFDPTKTASSQDFAVFLFYISVFTLACIATITAFLVTALPRIWPSPYSKSLILWIAPGLILGSVLNRWTASFRAKYETPAAKSTSP